MISVKDLNVSFGQNHVVKSVSFDVAKGETLGIVGESGCGKSTVLRSLAGLEGGWTGDIALDGKSVAAQRTKPEMLLSQMVFQDPYGSLHPRHRIGRILAEPVRAMKLGDGWDKVAEALEQVSLPTDLPSGFRTNCRADNASAWPLRGR